MRARPSLPLAMAKLAGLTCRTVDGGQLPIVPNERPPHATTEVALDGVLPDSRPLRAWDRFWAEPVQPQVVRNLQCRTDESVMAIRAVLRIDCCIVSGVGIDRQHSHR